MAEAGSRAARRHDDGRYRAQGRGLPITMDPDPAGEGVNGQKEEEAPVRLSGIHHHHHHERHGSVRVPIGGSRMRGPGRGVGRKGGHPAPSRWRRAWKAITVILARSQGGAAVHAEIVPQEVPDRAIHRSNQKRILLGAFRSGTWYRGCRGRADRWFAAAVAAVAVTRAVLRRAAVRDGGIQNGRRRPRHAPPRCKQGRPGRRISRRGRMTAGRRGAQGRTRHGRVG